MVGSASMRGSGFSWADEVEEGEEGAVAGEGEGWGQAQEQQKQKPNPFGSARPREVVLQEKGIDWRQLDFHLQRQQQQRPSPSGHEFHDEKLWKQSNHQHTRTVLSTKQQVPFRGSPVSSSTPQIQSPILLVPPPLRYPPKYVAGFLYQPGVSNTLNELSSGYQRLKLEKENRFREGRKLHNLKSDSAMCGNRRGTTTDLVQAKEAQQKGGNRILGEYVVYGNKYNPGLGSANGKEKLPGRNSLGLPLVNQNIGSPQTPSNGRRPRNIQDDLGIAGTAETNKAKEDERHMITRKVRDLSVKQIKNGGRYTGHGKIKADTAGNSQKKFEKKQIEIKF